MPEAQPQLLNTALGSDGFIVIAGPADEAHLPNLIEDYELAVGNALPGDIRVGSTSVRTNGILRRASSFSTILNYEPLLDAAHEIIRKPFRLSSFHSRSIRPGAVAQALHQDVRPGEAGWPLVGFIFMIDAFQIGNGATRFIPSDSRGLREAPVGKHEVHACGAAGSMIIFDGSVWHGHSANQTANWRRSIQGALVPA